MSKRQRPATLLVPKACQNLKAQFLNAAKELFPLPLRLLEEDIYHGTMNVEAWAEKFNVQGTWIEDWATQTVSEWRSNPHVYPMWAPPPANWSQSDLFSFHIDNVQPFALASRGVLTGGFRGAESEPDDWRRFEDHMHNVLSEHLRDYRQRIIDSQASREVVFPNDYEKKLAVAVYYTFGGMIPAEIIKYPVFSRDKTVINRWLSEILPILDLKPRARGWRRNHQR